ncbi:MAG TPA: cytochrome c [Xanthomonadaceae bacterium]
MTLRILSASVLLVFAGAAVAKGDPAAGAIKAKPCTACHGNDFNSEKDGQYPRLAGQYADYIARALHEYKEGGSTGRNNSTMKGMAAPLSDQDIDDVAAYISSLPGKLQDLSHMKK